MLRFGGRRWKVDERVLTCVGLLTHDWSAFRDPDDVQNVVIPMVTDTLCL